MLIKNINKKNQEPLSFNNNDEIKCRKEYIIKNIIDSEYYFNKYKSINNSNNILQQLIVSENNDNIMNEFETIIDNSNNRTEIQNEELISGGIEINSDSSFEFESTSHLNVSISFLFNDYDSFSELIQLSKEIKEINKINYSSSLMQFKYIIGKHKYTCEMIKEINNQLLSIGFDKKVYIYTNNEWNKPKEYKCSDWINNIEIVKKLTAKNNFDSIICTKSSLIYMNNIIYKSAKNNNFLLKINDDQFKFILIQKNEVIMCRLSFNHIIDSTFIPILEGYYREGIVINSNIFAITSNRIITGGDDKIIFYNINTYKIFKEIKG